MVRPTPPARFCLSDVDADRRLFGSCDSCLNIAHIDRGMLARRFGLGRPLAVIAGRLSCQRCKSRKVRLLLVSASARPWAQWYVPEARADEQDFSLSGR